MKTRVQITVVIEHEKESEYTEIAQRIEDSIQDVIGVEEVDFGIGESDE